jgi:hypothetical protein
MKSRMRIISVLLLSAVVVLMLWPRHAIGETYLMSQMLWHDEEAFVFVNASRGGFEDSYFTWALSQLRLYGARPTNSRRLGFVFRITPTSVEQYQHDGALPANLIVADGYVFSYASRWINGRFEPYEPRRIAEAFSKQPPQEFSDVEGWSKRSFNVPSGGDTRTVDFQLSGKPARLILSRDDGTRSIDLERAGASPQRLLSAPEGVRWVSAEEYDQYLGR